MKRTPLEQRLIERSQSGRTDLPGWAQSRAVAAAESFAADGLPHRRVEAWKYTDLRQKLGRPLEARSVVSKTVDLPDVLNVVVNDTGQFYVGGEIDGVEILSLSDALARRPDLIESQLGQTKALLPDAMTSLNTALMESGVVIIAQKGMAVEKPICLKVAPGKSDDLTFIRNLIIAEEGASLTVIEDWQRADTASSVHIVNEMRVGVGARLAHLRIQTEDTSATNIVTTAVDVDTKGAFAQYALTLGAGLSRSETRVHLTGEGADAKLAGAFVLSGQQHADTTTHVSHAVPNCTCDEIFRGVLADRARGVFQGKIEVQKDAQKTDGRMMTRTLLLSDKAEMDAKPELEIYADDVKCAHGATIGTIDDNALFYLQSRGIPVDEARRLLIGAFVEETLEPLSDEDMKNVLRGLLSDRLERLSEGAA